MQELRDLLMEWSRLEGDRCRYYKDDFKDDFSEDFSVKRGDGFITVWGAGIGDISTSGLDILQGAIQEAIASHGYRFWLELRRDGKFYARIHRGTDLPYQGAKSPYQSWHGDAAEEGAIALLEAYVSCLKGLGGAA